MLLHTLVKTQEIGANWPRSKIKSRFFFFPRLIFVFEFISPRLKNLREYSFLHASIIPLFNLNPVRGHIVATILITPYMDFIS